MGRDAGTPTVVLATDLGMRCDRATARAKRLADAAAGAGIAVAGVDGELFEDVLRRADDALYLAKSEGRNRVSGPLPRLAA